jgi:hypothetical protein
MDHSIAHVPDTHRPALIAEDEQPDRYIAVVVHGAHGGHALDLLRQPRQRKLLPDVVAADLAARPGAGGPRERRAAGSATGGRG